MASGIGAKGCTAKCVGYVSNRVDYRKLHKYTLFKGSGTGSCYIYQDFQIPSTESFLAGKDFIKKWG